MIFETDVHKSHFKMYIYIYYNICNYNLVKGWMTIPNIKTLEAWLLETRSHSPPFLESGHKVRSTRNSQKWRRKVFGSMSSEMMNFINWSCSYCKLRPPPKLNSSPLKQWWLEGDPFSFGFGKAYF